ncbi:hypothetical protein BDZ90DRAFT_279723 [Jaminaea rosea]|uniref:Uncharacterized protein n=1 Tax=Jaminaea rosea TaxID=1569628 RepID=A0A316UTX6_9BASI|nr:hypothetical protein BDZ90DRAFT_279723 [Jaminaea rosea]PWN27363.1 hypothetical protein BDZ90DRAFT_279723 [Jaminaea rosea]
MTGISPSQASPESPVLPSPAQTHMPTVTPPRLTRSERTALGLPPRPSRIEQLAQANPSDETDDATLSEHFSSPSSTTDSSMPQSPDLARNVGPQFALSKTWADMTEEDLALQGPVPLPSPTFEDETGNDHLTSPDQPPRASTTKLRSTTISTAPSPIDGACAQRRTFTRSSSEPQAVLSQEHLVQSLNAAWDEDKSPSHSGPTPEPKSPLSQVCAPGEADSAPISPITNTEAAPVAASTQTSKAPAISQAPISDWDSPPPPPAAPAPQWRPPPILSRNAYLARPQRGRGAGRTRGRGVGIAFPFGERPTYAAPAAATAAAEPARGPHGWHTGNKEHASLQTTASKRPFNDWDESHFPPLPGSAARKSIALESTSKPEMTTAKETQATPREQPVPAAPALPPPTCEWDADPTTPDPTHMRNERGEWMGRGRGRWGGAGWPAAPRRTTTASSRRAFPSPVHSASFLQPARKPDSWDDEGEQTTGPQQQAALAMNGVCDQADGSWDDPVATATATTQQLTTEVPALIPHRAATAAHTAAAPTVRLADTTLLPPPGLPSKQKSPTPALQSTNPKLATMQIPIPATNRPHFPWQSPFSHAVDTIAGSKVSLKGIAKGDQGVLIGDKTAQQYLSPRPSSASPALQFGSLKLELADDVDAAEQRGKRVSVSIQTDLHQSCTVSNGVLRPGTPRANGAPPAIYVQVSELHRSLPSGLAIDAGNRVYDVRGNPTLGDWVVPAPLGFRPAPPMAVVNGWEHGKGEKAGPSSAPAADVFDPTTNATASSAMTKQPFSQAVPLPGRPSQRLSSLQPDAQAVALATAAHQVMTAQMQAQPVTQARPLLAHEVPTQQHQNDESGLAPPIMLKSQPTAGGTATSVHSAWPPGEGPDSANGIGVNNMSSKPAQQQTHFIGQDNGYLIPRSDQAQDWATHSVSTPTLSPGRGGLQHHIPRRGAPLYPPISMRGERPRPPAWTGPRQGQGITESTDEVTYWAPSAQYNVSAPQQISQSSGSWRAGASPRRGRGGNVTSPTFHHQQAHVPSSMPSPVAVTSAWTPPTAPAAWIQHQQQGVMAAGPQHPFFHQHYHNQFQPSQHRGFAAGYQPQQPQQQLRESGADTESDGGVGGQGGETWT